jgi:leucine dehydrogenase
VINAGGLINVYGELHGWTSERSMRKAGEIYATLIRIFDLAQEEGVPTHAAADRVAELRIESIGRIQQTWV